MLFTMDQCFVRDSWQPQKGHIVIKYQLLEWWVAIELQLK